MADVRKRRRRRWRAAPILVALALLLWLGARGLDGGTPDAEEAAPDVGTGVPDAPARAAALTGDQSGGPADLPDPTREVEFGDLAVVDRLWGCLRRMADATHGETFGVGFAAWRTAKELPLNAVQRARVDEAAVAMQSRLADWLREDVDGAARRGDVLLAAALLSAVTEDAEAAQREMIAGILSEECGWPDWQAGGASGALLEAPPISRGTPVRLWVEGVWSVGTVVASRGDEVTVRVRTPRGDRFPTVQRVEVEPESSDREVALGQAGVAQRLGRPCLAAAWLARAAALR